MVEWPPCGLRGEPAWEAFTATLFQMLSIMVTGADMQTPLMYGNVLKRRMLRVLKNASFSYSQWLTGYWKLKRCKIALMTENKEWSRETHESRQLFDSDSTIMVAMVKCWFQFWKKLWFQNLVSCLSAYSLHGRLPFKTTLHVTDLEGCVRRYRINVTQIQYNAKFRPNLFQKINNNYWK